MAVAEIARNRPTAFVSSPVVKETAIRFPRVKSAAHTVVQFLADQRQTIAHPHQTWKEASVGRRTKVAAALSVPFIIAAAGCSSASPTPDRHPSHVNSGTSISASASATETPVLGPKPKESAPQTQDAYTSYTLAQLGKSIPLAEPISVTVPASEMAITPDAEIQITESNGEVVQGNIGLIRINSHTLLPAFFPLSTKDRTDGSIESDETRVVLQQRERNEPVKLSGIVAQAKSAQLANLLNQLHFPNVFALAPAVMVVQQANGVQK